MSAVAKFENLKDLIVELRGQSVLLDRDVAQIYGVETRDINKAVSNNPDKFPAGYVVELSKQQKDELVENFHRFNKLKHSTANPKAFPGKGLYKEEEKMRNIFARSARKKLQSLPIDVAGLNPTNPTNPTDSIDSTNPIGFLLRAPCALHREPFF